MVGLRMYLCRLACNTMHVMKKRESLALLAALNKLAVCHDVKFMAVDSNVSGWHKMEISGLSGLLF